MADEHPVARAYLVLDIGEKTAYFMGEVKVLELTSPPVQDDTLDPLGFKEWERWSPSPSVTLKLEYQRDKAKMVAVNTTKLSKKAKKIRRKAAKGVWPYHGKNR